MLSWLLVGGKNNLVRRGWMSKFFVSGGTPPSPKKGKPCINFASRFLHIYSEDAPCISHTSCAKVDILLLQDLRTLCVTNIYGIYFHLSVQYLYYNKFISSWTHLIRPNDGRSVSQKSAFHIYIGSYKDCI